MENIKFLNIIAGLAVLLFFSCQNNQSGEIKPISPEQEENAIIDIVPTDCSEPLGIQQLERSKFEGKILGKTAVFKEFLAEDRENIEIQQLPDFVEVYSWRNFFRQVGYFNRTLWRTTKLTISAGIEGIRNQSIYIITPSLPITDEKSKWSYNNSQTLKDLFCRGQKELEQFQALSDSLTGFTVIYNQSSPNSVENTYASSAFGSQRGSILQVIDVKQFTPLPPSKAPYGLQVKYKINCKLYKTTGEYVGDIKDAELVTKYYYEPISQ